MDRENFESDGCMVVLLIVLLNVEWLTIEKKVVWNWICCVNEVCSVC